MLAVKIRLFVPLHLRQMPFGVLRQKIDVLVHVYFAQIIDRHSSFIQYAFTVGHFAEPIQTTIPLHLNQPANLRHIGRAGGFHVFGAHPVEGFVETDFIELVALEDIMR